MEFFELIVKSWMMKTPASLPLNDTGHQIVFYCKWTPCSCTVFSYCCHVHLWSVSSGDQLQLFGLTCWGDLLPAFYTCSKWTCQRDPRSIHWVVTVGHILSWRNSSSNIRAHTPQSGLLRVFVIGFLLLLSIESNPNY